MSSNQAQRQQAANANQSQRQQTAKSNQQNRQNFANENWDGYHGGYEHPWGAAAVVAGTAAVVAGTTAAASGAYAAPVETLPCTPSPAVVNGATYYQCGATWYTKAYSGNDVSYIAVAPPQ
jgi:hypothetical protein